MSPIERIMRTAPVIPVLVIEDAADARPLAEALVAGGLKVLEVTLRTRAAHDVIRAMKTVPGAIVGAGTVVNEGQLAAALEAGAEFIVSPGLTDTLGRAVIASGVPYLPGVATASDIMRGLDLGLTRFKFFPAEAAGGIQASRPPLIACSTEHKSSSGRSRRFIFFFKKSFGLVLSLDCGFLFFFVSRGRMKGGGKKKKESGGAVFFFFSVLASAHRSAPVRSPPARAAAVFVRHEVSEENKRGKKKYQYIKEGFSSKKKYIKEGQWYQWKKNERTNSSHEYLPKFLFS